MIYTSLFHFSAWFTAFCRIHTPAVLIPGFPAGIQDGLWVLSNLFKSGSSDSKYFIPFCSFPAIFRGIAPLFVLSWRSCFAHPSFLCVCVSVCKWPAAENPCNSLYENSSVFFFFLYDKGGEFLSFLVKLLAVLWNKKALWFFCILHMCFYTYIILEYIIKTFVKACFTFTGKTKINLCRLWHLWMFSGIGLVLCFFFFYFFQFRVMANEMYSIAKKNK